MSMFMKPVPGLVRLGLTASASVRRLLATRFRRPAPANQLLPAIAGLMLFLAGCDSHRHEKVVVREERPVIVERDRRPDVVVVEKTPRRDVTVIEKTPRRDVVYVREAPPAVIIEKRPPNPGPDRVWIDGFWKHDGRKYVWSSGRYERSRSGYVYVKPRWIRTDRGWHCEPGGWRRVGRP